MNFWVAFFPQDEFLNRFKNYLLLAGLVTAATFMSSTAAVGAATHQRSDRHLSSQSPDASGAIAAATNADHTACPTLPNRQTAGVILSYQEGNETHLYKLQGKDASLNGEVTLPANTTLADSDAEFADTGLTFKAVVDNLIQPYLGEVVTTADLRALQDEISRLYIEGGYLSSWADCVEFDENGRLVIHVTEGFIQDVNIGWVNEEGTVYVPAQDGPRDWLYAANYLAPILKDENGQPQRPVNLKQLEVRLQALAADPRFAPLEMFSRLRVPTLTEVEAIALRRNINFNTDTVAPGASVLEMQLQNIVAEVGDVEEDPFAVNLVTNTVELEQRRSNAFKSYFGDTFEQAMVDESLIRFALHSLEQQRPDIQAAVVYIAADGDRVVIRVETAYAPPIEIESIARFEAKAPEREFTFTEEGTFVEERDNEADNGNFISRLFRGDNVNRDTLVVEAETFWRLVQNPNSAEYREYADNLYDLLIRPIQEELEKEGINTLLVAMDADLGLLPLASLYDSEDEQYLAEKYRLAIIPNFRSLDIRPSNLNQTNVLAMGASEFSDSDRYAPLTAVPIELSLIANIWGQGDNQQVEVLRNEDFTLANLRQQRRDRPYPIVHLASHANFRSGRPGDSSIQFWDTTLPLNKLQLSTLNFNKPPLELLVLSACQTALGDEDAVLGFAGSFLNAEVKSVLASLWYVNDLASLLYMMEFYRNLRNGLTKAEAVHNAQRAFLDEQRTQQNLKELARIVQALLQDERSRESLTEAELERLQRLSREIGTEAQIAEVAADFNHPFYWSAYTLVGNPW